MVGFPDNEDAILEAKRILGNAMAGLVLVYGAYLLVNTLWVILQVTTSLPFPFNILQH